MKWILTLVLAMFLSAVSFAQSREEQVTQSETADASSTVKFRGYQNITEDVPFMSEDWKISFFQLAAVEMDRLDDDGPASLFMYNYLSFNYKIDDDQRIAIRPVFTVSTPGTDKYDEEISKWKTELGDAYIQYSRFNMFEIGPFGTRANLRLYLPTSQNSQNNGMIAQIHPEYYLETSFGRSSGVELQLKGDYFFQSKRAYSFTTGGGDVIQTTNKETELETIIEFRQRLNSKFNLKPRVSWHDEWFLSSPVNNRASRHTQEFAVGMGLEWKPSEAFNTTLQVSNVTPVYPKFKKKKMWLPENNEVVALTNYRF